MFRTRRPLADGRTVVYYDRTRTSRDAVDTRDLPPIELDSALVYDQMLDEWVVHATHRQTRTFLPPADLCPLCPTVAGRATEIPEPDYEVAVFENRFPALSGASGRCEVVCYTSDHDATFVDLDTARVRLVVDVWADRTAELAALPEVEQVFCFENHGVEIGVTLGHPHGQIYAYPFVTPRATKILAATERYETARGRSLVADLLAAAGDRTVAANDEWVAFVPAAARWPYEVQLFPRRQTPDISDLDDAQRDAFAQLYPEVLRRFVGVVDDSVPYVAAWNQAPAGSRERWWLHLQLFTVRRAPGRLKYLAGSESGMGVFVSDTAPDDVAARLRNLA